MADVIDAPAPPGARAEPPHGGPRIVEARIPDTIVPIRLVWAGALVLALLIVAIAVDKLWPLEFFHVAFGAFWTIMDLFLGLLLGPILGTMTLEGRMELTRRLMPKIAVIMPVAVTCTLAAGWQLGRHLGTVDSSYMNHDWIVASYIVVGALAIVALGVMEPANVAVLFELRKRRPNPQVIGRLMQRFIYTTGVIGLGQVATLVIMTKVASG
ncbi:MAG TPA: hypothetical protein VHB30_08790 [Solirubrobacteraceae bacterium]|jgi:hypothetical protein|nr:hypothetical protein [Solirubrobacteraceae bacterium]